MIHKNRLPRELRSRSVSTDSSGTAFLTPIARGTVDRLNSGASYATGGMFRDLRSLPDNPAERIDRSKPIMNPPLIADTAQHHRLAMKNLVEENLSLKLQLVALRGEKNECIDSRQLEIPEDNIRSACLDVSSQTDMDELQLKQIVEKAHEVDHLTVQITDIRHKYRESTKRNESLESKLNVLILQQAESSKLWASERETLCTTISSLESEIKVQLTAVLPEKTKAKVKQPPCPLRREGNITKFKAVIDKFKKEYKRDQEFTKNAFTTFNKYLSKSKDEIESRVKVEIGAIKSKHEKEAKAQDIVTNNMCSQISILDGLLKTALECHQNTLNDTATLNQHVLSATECLLDLENKHKVVVQSLQHDSHVRDLARISALRESALETDRVANDLQFCR